MGNSESATVDANAVFGNGARPVVVTFRRDDHRRGFGLRIGRGAVVTDVLHDDGADLRYAAAHVRWGIGDVAPSAEASAPSPVLGTPRQPQRSPGNRHVAAASGTAPPSAPPRVLDDHDEPAREADAPPPRAGWAAVPPRRTGRRRAS